ncbi:hypothetical protein ACFQPF_03535 [Fictibacillus iocasae]|uniref:KAP NTPase domain-containing protein n=1 Tax=Fictibacillus iocasae TaxID=2715437 RepID=A0ABW2NJ90_9BACL
MIKTSHFFKPSVNIKLDKNNQILLQTYLPTPSHAEAFSGVINGFVNEDSSKSHIVIGAYGTGKSFLATILSALLSKEIDRKTYKLLLKKYSTVNDKIHANLKKVQNINTTFLPVLLNGNEGNFRKAILKSLMRALKDNDLKIVLPGAVQSILDSIDIWKNDFPETYRKFDSEVKEKYGNITTFIEELEDNSESHIQWFIEIFPMLSSGSQFQIDIEQNFIGQIQYVIDQLKGKSLGVFFIYDEFGRFIQSLNQDQIHEAMQDIQDLAELCNSYSNHSHLLLITHKNLRNYSFKFNEELNNEFGRIEKRFVSYNINSDPSTFLRLGHEVITQLRKKHTVKVDANYKNQMLAALRMFPLFPDLNDVELENIVVEGSYPLHPVTNYLLPILSNIFAQNERTLFTFLESGESGGLIEHLKNDKGIYLPHKLFDYFFGSMSSDEMPEELKVYKQIISKLPFEEDSLEVQLLKFVTLWNVCGLQAKFKLSDEFISFALDYNLLLNSQLDLLKSLKAIRFNRIYGNWELFNGSSLDLEEVIIEKNKELILNKEKQLELMKKFTVPKYYLANEYNYQKSMTRFCSVIPLYASSVIEGTLDTDQLRKKANADAILVNIILDENFNQFDILNKVLNWEDKNVIFAVPSFNSKHFEPLLRRYTIINKLLEDKVFIQNDPNVRKELVLSLEDIEHEITSILLNYSSFNGDIIWVYDNKKLTIKNKIMLENILSEMMQELYPFTPEVRNDAFNRKNITRVQKKAAIKVIDYIINHKMGEDLEIEGNGPDYLIYATLLKNNGININNLSEINNPYISKLKQDVMKQINTIRREKLHSLTSIFTEKPYGIRKPLIPILLVTLLKEYWDNILFYRNDMYISEVTGEFLYKMLEEETEFEYRYFDTNKKYNLLLNDINVTFNSIEEKIQISHPLYLQKILLKWLRSLPRVSQISESMSTYAIKFKEIIRFLEIDPQAGLDKLNNLYKDNNFDLLEVKKEIDLFYTHQSQLLEKEVLNLVDKSNFNELQLWCTSQKEDVKKNNSFIRAILSSKGDNWIDDLAFIVVGVKRQDWSDTTLDMFKTQLLYWFNKLNDLEEQNSIIVNIGNQTKVINKVELTNKSEVIYQNVNRIIKNAGRNVSKEEVETIVYKLLNEFVQ